MKNNFFLLLSLTLLAAPLWGANLDATDIHAAAENFIRSDSVGASLLFGRTIKSVEKKGALYLVRLTPSGYVVFSGNDLAEPVVAFSTNDYVEEAGSPLTSLLALADTNAVAAAVLETTDIARPFASSAWAGTTSSTRRAAKWATLLGRADNDETRIYRALTAARHKDTLAVKVPAFLTTQWRQQQPYNDYAPVDLLALVASEKRQRYVCGCAATAYAQVLNYWQWPRRFDGVVEADHTTDGHTSPFTVRFDGRAPHDWSAMKNTYAQGSSSTGYDLRDSVAESIRYPIARLVMQAAVLARMGYTKIGAGAVFGTAEAATPWFVATNQMFRTSAKNDAAFFALLRADMERKIPVPVAIPEHQVVANGWAEDEYGTSFVALNFGWGGNNDGYFNITETDTKTTRNGYINIAILGYTPLKTVQVEPLPDVSAPDLTLSWYAPPRLADDYEGYDVRIRSYDNVNTTVRQDFSSLAVTNASPTGIFVGTVTDADIGNATPLLRIRPRASGDYLVMDAEMVTEATTFSYRLRYDRALGLSVCIQLSHDGSAWEDLDTPTLGTGADKADWATRSLSLGAFAGKPVYLRVHVTSAGDSYPGSGAFLGVQLDDFEMTNVLHLNERHVFCDKATRTATLTGLEIGKVHLFTVTPRCEGAVASASVHTRIAATGESFPAISSVTSFSATSAPVVEGFFRECARGTNVFLVACSKNVTTLQAWPSHLTLVPDEAVEVCSLGEGQFVVTVDGSRIDYRNDRTRMILTLAASTAGGATAYKDLSLRFSDEQTPDAAYEKPAPKETTTSIPVPYTWLIEKGLATADASAEEMERAAERDTDGDGYANFAEYLCGTDPLDAADAFKVFISREGDETIISWSPTNTLATYTVIGVTNLTDRTWVETNDANRAGLRFFRVRATRKK